MTLFQDSMSSLFSYCLILLWSVFSDSATSEVQVWRDSTLVFTSSADAHASMFYSRSFPREYYLYVQPGASVRFDLSHLSESQKQSVRSELSLRAKSYWSMSNGEGDYPILTLNARASDHKIQLYDFDRVIVVRKPKTATNPLLLRIEYLTTGGDQVDTISVSPGRPSATWLPPRFPLRLRSVSVMEPDLYNHPSVVTDLTIDDKVYHPTVYSGDDRVEQDYPFVRATAQYVFRRPLWIWKSKNLSVHYGVLKADAQLEDRDLTLILGEPEGWSLSIPVWLLLLTVGVFLSLLGISIALAKRSRRGAGASNGEIARFRRRIEELEREKDLGAAAISENVGLKREKVDLSGKVEALHRDLAKEREDRLEEIHKMSLRNEELEQQIVSLQKALAELQEDSLDAPASFDKGLELLRLMRSYFAFLAHSGEFNLKSWLIPLSFSWNKLTEEMEALAQRGKYDFEAGRDLLVRYLDDEESCLNMIVRLRAYMADETLSAFLKSKGITCSSVWWPDQVMTALLAWHGIRLKTPPELLHSLYGPAYEPAGGVSMLLSQWSASYAHLPNMSVFDIGRAGYAVEDGPETKYSVFYHIQPQS